MAANDSQLRVHATVDSNSQMEPFTVKALMTQHVVRPSSVCCFGSPVRRCTNRSVCAHSCARNQLPGGQLILRSIWPLINAAAGAVGHVSNCRTAPQPYILHQLSVKMFCMHPRRSSASHLLLEISWRHFLHAMCLEILRKLLTDAGEPIEAEVPHRVKQLQRWKGTRHLQ